MLTVLAQEVRQRHYQVDLHHGCSAFCGYDGSDSRKLYNQDNTDVGRKKHTPGHTEAARRQSGYGQRTQDGRQKHLDDFVPCKIRVKNFGQVLLRQVVITK